MIDFIVKGGMFMYPILLCSIIALAVFLERLWVLRRRTIIPTEFIRNIEDLEVAISKAVVNNARHWAYVEAILKRWKTDGFDSKNGRSGKKGTNVEHKPEDYTGGKYAAWIEAGADTEET